MIGFTSQGSIVLLLLLSAITFHISMCSRHREARCNEKDRWTLLNFKQGVTVNEPSWSSEEDCCAWIGVQCDNITGRVTELDLKGEFLEGEINLSSLLELEFLNYLDLSENDFKVISIPPIHDSAATTQRHDNQSLVTTPFPLTNFSNLRYLDLSANHLHIDNLHWISRLSSLKYLNLSGIDLHKETNWLQLVATLPSLSELRLGDCQLSNINPSLKSVNFTSLVTLVLSENHFDSELPHWFFNLSNDISYLELSSNSLKGQVPTSLLNLRNLKYLDLSFNKLEGSIPNWFGQYKHLQHLDLSLNLFHGPIPSTLGNLSSLIDLNIRSNFLIGSLPNSFGQLFNLNTMLVGNNSLSGVLSEIAFSKLYNLKTLGLRGSSFAFDFDPDWIPPFQLHELDLANTLQGPNFPTWLYTQRSLQILDLSSSGISTVDGDMFWSFVAGIGYIVLSNNSISGDLSNITLNSGTILLDHNNFTGGLPQITENVSVVDVSHNFFSGPIFPLVCSKGNSENQLAYVDTSYNFLSGAFPDCWEQWKELYYMKLGSNKLSGEVSLDFSNLTKLQFMDLGRNEFSGNIPIKMPQSLEVMILRSNQFAGNIPPHLCNLSSLIELDLAHNKLSGSIPQCVYNMTAMASGNVSDVVDAAYKFDLVAKGQELEFKHELYNPWWPTIDLSANNLSGEIPPELFSLIRLYSLNLSRNHLTGMILKKIVDMKNLESLDLSNNQFYGEIPPSISTLSFLSYLNLSYNNFIGQIPLGTQLQSFNASSYIGNPKLCGAPLAKNCTVEENPNKAKQDGEHDEEGDFERDSLYLGMGIGFAVGFRGVCGSLFLYRAWRHTYFHFLNHVADRLYVVVAVKFNSFGGI